MVIIWLMMINNLVGCGIPTIYILYREMIRDVSFIQRNIMGIWHQIPFIDWLVVYLPL